MSEKTTVMRLPDAKFVRVTSDDAGVTLMFKTGDGEFFSLGMARGSAIAMAERVMLAAPQAQEGKIPRSPTEHQRGRNQSETLDLRIGGKVLKVRASLDELRSMRDHLSALIAAKEQPLH